jgi:hypothetical protein
MRYLNKMAPHDKAPYQIQKNKYHTYHKFLETEY